MTSADMLLGAGGETPLVLTGLTGWHIAGLVLLTMVVVYVAVWVDDYDHHRRMHGGDTSQPCDGQCGRMR